MCLGLWKSLLARNAKRRVGPADFLQVVTPFLPLAALVGKGFLHHIAQLSAVLRQRPYAQFPDQARVTFLLPRNDLVDNDRATGGDRSEEHRSARFGDH